LTSNEKNDKIQEKDLIGNKILCLLTICFVSALVLMFIYRVFNNVTYILEMYTALKVMAGIGAAGVLYFGYRMIRNKAEKIDESKKLINAKNLLKFFAAFLISVLAILRFDSRAIYFLYVALPVYAGLYLIFHTYPREFYLFSQGSVVAFAALYVFYRVESYVVLSSVIVPLILSCGAISLVKGLYYYVKKSKKSRDVYYFRRFLVYKRNMNVWFMIGLFVLFSLSCFLYPLLGKAALLYGLYALAALFFMGILYYTFRIMSE